MEIRSARRPPPHGVTVSQVPAHRDTPHRANFSSGWATFIRRQAERGRAPPTGPRTRNGSNSSGFFPFAAMPPLANTAVSRRTCHTTPDHDAALLHIED